MVQCGKAVKPERRPGLITGPGHGNLEEDRAPSAKLCLRKGAMRQAVGHPIPSPDMSNNEIPAALSHDMYGELRAAMVDVQIRRRGITDDRVLRAMASVPRHEFVPPQWQSRAYADEPLPIGAGQAISQPYIVAVMTAALRLTGSEKVL